MAMPKTSAREHGLWHGTRSYWPAAARECCSHDTIEQTNALTRDDHLWIGASSSCGLSTDWITAPLHAAASAE